MDHINIGVNGAGYRPEIEDIPWGLCENEPEIDLQEEEIADMTKTTYKHFILSTGQETSMLD